jgi:8-oxo-dGTP pyrophosphatase MutT (NUDIX family)
MLSAQELYQLADELRAHAALGLQYSQNEYDRHRFQQILSVSARLVASVEERPFEEVLSQFEDNLQQVSPRLAADAAIFRNGKILLIQRSDSGLWCMPGGGVDVGETLTEAVLRELWEETGLRGRIIRLLGILDSRKWRSLSKVQLYYAMFEVEIDENSEPSTSLEASAVGFFGENELPSLFSSHCTRVPLVFKQMRHQAPIPYLD